SDSDDPVFLKTTISHLVEEVGYRLRKQGMKAKTVTLKVRYSDFKTITRSRTVGEMDGDAEIYRIARDLLEKAHTRRVRIRLLGVCLSNLTPAVAQRQLFEDERERRKSALYRSLDRIRDKFGLKLHFGSSIWRR
ncbi:MAG: DNA polymerase IV, partial [Candidatus Aminicenantes bacterium]|nr:DNA polymerase IV [Candidatus Aminicenantes bacterium]